MVGRDVLQLAWLSPKMGRRCFSADFPRPSLSSLMPSLFCHFVLRLAQDETKVAELREDVSRAWAPTGMVEARAARANDMAPQRAILLATIHGEVDEVAWRVSILEGELRAVSWLCGAAEQKLPSLAAMATTVDRRWVG
jgi:hypothetical protein